MWELPSKIKEVEARGQVTPFVANRSLELLTAEPVAYRGVPCLGAVLGVPWSVLPGVLSEPGVFGAGGVMLPGGVLSEGGLFGAPVLPPGALSEGDVVGAPVLLGEVLSEDDVPVKG